MFGIDLRRMKLTNSAKTYELRNACGQALGANVLITYVGVKRPTFGGRIL